jgi:hypothetical protein
MISRYFIAKFSTAHRMKVDKSAKPIIDRAEMVERVEKV